jgi:GATA-binding protein, other eukaryote
MKKPVIKRRKRVPAASVLAPGRLSDQAAAEALVSVGRGVQSTEEDEGDDEQPKRKRVRRSGFKGRRREDDDGVSQSSQPHQSGAPWDVHHPHHNGLDLPPLANIMPQGDVSMLPMYPGGLFPKTMYHAMHTTVPPPASSYMRSSSRSHSPSNGLPALPHHGLTGMFMPGRLSPNGLPAVPTLEELHHHYRELDMHRMRMLEMLERTDRMLDGVRRGIEKARGATPPSSSSPRQQQQRQEKSQLEEHSRDEQPQPPKEQEKRTTPQPIEIDDQPESPVVPASVPLPNTRAEGAASPSPRENIWPVSAASAATIEEDAGEV